MDVLEATTANSGVAHVLVNLPEFQGLRVYKALQLAIGSAGVLKSAHANSGSLGEHYRVSLAHLGYGPFTNMQCDTQAAKDFLAQTGFSDGPDLEVTCNDNPLWELAAVQTLIEQWKENNTRVDIKLLPFSESWNIRDKVPFRFTSWLLRPLGFIVLILAYRSGVP